MDHKNETNAWTKAAKWATANPGKVAAVGAGAMCLTAPMFVEVSVPGLLVFGSIVIVGGSIGAGIRSVFCKIAPPSLVAATMKNDKQKKNKKRAKKNKKQKKDGKDGKNGDHENQEDIKVDHKNEHVYTNTVLAPAA